MRPITILSAATILALVEFPARAQTANVAWHSAWPFLDQGTPYGFQVSVWGNWPAHAGGSVAIWLSVYDEDPFDPDDLLHRDTTLTINPDATGAFNHVFVANLWGDVNCYVAGALGDSGESTAEVYVLIEHTDFWSTNIGTTASFSTSCFPLPVLGTNYCPSTINSTTSAAWITATGNPFASANDFVLDVENLPINTFGYFLTSTLQVAFTPAGSQGAICVGSPIGRYIGPGQIQNSGFTGTVMLRLDLTRTPQPTGSTAIAAGQTWNFQYWYRDANPVPTSNTSNGVSMLFR